MESNPMRMERRRLADLIPADYNPRKSLTPEDPEYQDIKASIEGLGYADPIVINYDGTIIKGHQRRTVMMDLGYEEADVVVIEIRDKAKEKMVNIALNKITGKWDLQILKDLLVNLDLEGYDFSLTGFHQDELEDLIQQLDVPDEATEDTDFDPDVAREEIETPITNRGDVWQLGRHRLMCGDATSMEDAEILMAGNKIDLVITDPPYNVDYGAKVGFLNGYLDQTDSRTNSVIQNDHMDTASFYSFLLAAFQSMNDAMRPGAGIYVFHAESTGLQFRQAYNDAGLKLAQCLVWEKNAFVLGRQDYQWRHEPILYGWKEGAAHYFVNDRTQDTVLLEDELDFQSMKKQELLAFIQKYVQQYKDLTTVHFENKPARNDMHPTMKPVPLIGRLMNNSSRPGWLVGDFFGGSGSTLMAAEQLGRTAFIMELDEKNCDVIVQRWQSYTGQKAVKL
ncbi:MAG: site-specific DNA-methyltransferase [Faecalibacterium sp.]